MKTLIGIPSGDYEIATFAVTFNEYAKHENEAPQHYNKSPFYVDLYDIYGVPNVPILRQYKNHPNLISIVYDDFGIKSIEETDIPAKYRYNGYEDDKWFNDNND